MALPTITTPTYKVTLPSNGKRVEFRPFLVKEEKILLMALESESEQEMKEAVIQILTNCVNTKGIDFFNLPIFDIEYLFLQLRAKSVGEIAEPYISCTECGNSFELKIDISKIKPKKNKDQPNQFMLDDTGTLGITLKYPTLKSTVDIKDDSEYIKLIVSSIDEIFTSEEVFKAEDHTEEELEEFVDNIQTSQLEKILDFYRNMPLLEYKKKCTCPKCEHKFTVTLRGLKDFFI
tara:strand:+ start:19 stop:720 length:702 start_codon:yes stop_codon:yes gene_type:complete